MLSGSLETNFMVNLRQKTKKSIPGNWGENVMFEMAAILAYVLN